MSVSSGFNARVSDGRQLVLGKLVKSGAAGSVYLLPASPLQVAKIYHDSANRAEYERKLAAMLELAPQLPDIIENGHRYVQIAWPQALLRDERNHFLGFVMPAVDVQATSELEYILQERQARAANLPTGLGAKITLAANLAAVIAELHRQGHHVIDLKPVNLRFYPQSLYMAMLDCDGFSIQGKGERYPADQITPDYLAPEFQTGRLTAQGEEPQDRFALAVVVFQLLNFGIHPYSGRPLSDDVPTDIPGRIARRCYAYGSHPNRELAPSPVSGHKAMPADLRLLFDRAFESAGASRPSAGEWADTLKIYAQRSSLRLVACSKNAQHQHFAGMPCAACARDALLASTASKAQALRNSRPWLNTPARNPFQMPANATGIRSPYFQQPSPTMLPPAHRAVPKGWPGSLTSNARRTNSFDWSRVLLVIPLGAMILALSALFNAISPYTSLVSPPTMDSHTPTDLPAMRQQLHAILQAAANGKLPGSTWRIPMPPVGHRADIPWVGSAPFKQFAAHIDDYNEADRKMLVDQLLMALISNPGDGEAAYELGWLSLLAGQRSRAAQTFAQAIWVEPNRFDAWYGYGLASEDEQDTLGAMVFVDTMGNSTKIAQEFPPNFLRRAGLDPNQINSLQNKADEIELQASHAR